MATAPEGYGQRCLACDAVFRGLVCVVCREALIQLSDFVPDQIRSTDRDAPEDDEEQLLGCLLVDGYGRGHLFVLDAGDRPVSIGRREENDLMIAHGSVSRFHTEIERRPSSSSWRVRDRGSANGTFVEGKKLSGPTEIASGARLMLGESLGLLFYEVEAEALGRVARILAKQAVDDGTVHGPHRTDAPSESKSDLALAQASGGGGVATVGGTNVEVRLTELELALVELLAERLIAERAQPAAVRGYVRSSELLASDLPFDVPDPSSNNLRGLIKRVRDKFAAAGLSTDIIESRPPLGYRLTVTPSSS